MFHFLAALDSGKPFLVYDLETTELGDNARPWELGFVKIDGAKKWAAHEVTIDCGADITPKTLEFMQGEGGRPDLTADGHRTGMPEREALIRFADVIKGCTVVAHNGHYFDDRVIKAAYARHNLPIPAELDATLDTCELAWSLYGRGNGKLDKLAARFGVTRTGHAAMADAVATAHVMMRMIATYIEAQAA